MTRGASRKRFLPRPNKFRQDFGIIARRRLLVSRRCRKHQECNGNTLSVLVDNHDNEKQETAIADTECAIQNDLVLVPVFPGSGVHLIGGNACLESLPFDGPGRIMKYRLRNCRVILRGFRVELFVHIDLWLLRHFNAVHPAELTI
jgi:hypothetical protein